MLTSKDLNRNHTVVSGAANKYYETMKKRREEVDIMQEEIKKRSGTKFITEVPNESGAVVAMIAYQGHVLLACQHHVYELSEKKIFKKIKFYKVDKKVLTDKVQ